jgi:hypothetical protein
MNKWLLAALMVVGTMAAPVLATPAAQAAPGTSLVCDNTADTPYTGTYTSVTVPAGASCYLRNALVTGNFKALHGAGDVFLINTELQRNVHITGATGTVKIGVNGCGFDPLAGNNIVVTDSHNVAICWMTVDNNIMVFRNDGRIRLANNTVGNNIKVTSNLAYNPLPGDGVVHGNAHAIRLENNVAGNHIFVRNNADRPLLEENNAPAPTT